MFIAVLFIIAKTWKQPTCSSTGEWIKKTSYIYTMEYYSVIKINKTESFGEMWMDLKSTIHSEERKRKANIIH